MTVSRVPMLDLRRETGELDVELEDAFRRVLRSGHYILGPEVDAFEKECAAYIGVDHALGVSSGTDALLLALMALGIGCGDEVICPTYTFFATAGTVARVGAIPVFTDITPCCYGMSALDLETLITPRTKAIVVVHLFGQCAHMDPILSIASKFSIPIIEDAAQAIGATHHGHAAGTMGKVGCFSFFPSKNLGALGDAGLFVTNDAELAERARTLRVHGGKPKYHHGVVGGNFRIDALQAAMLRVKLRRLDGWTKRRQDNADSYDQQLSGLDTRVETPKRCQERHIYNQYTLRVKDSSRNRLRDFLGASHIGTEVYYPIPMHRQACFSSLSATHLPEAEAAAEQTLALPIFPELQADEIAYVTERLRAFFSS